MLNPNKRNRTTRINPNQFDRELFQGAGVIVTTPEEANLYESSGKLVIASERAEIVSRSLYKLRAAFGKYFDHVDRYRVYPLTAKAAFAAVEKGAEDEAVLKTAFDAACEYMSIPGRPYFAYGSNMDVEQMKERCKNAVLLGKASLPGWGYCYDASGFATIEWNDPETVHGLLWSISISDEVMLDRYEGVSCNCYEKVEVAVDCNGTHIDALAYASMRFPFSETSCRTEYVKLVENAAAAAGLPVPCAKRGDRDE